MSLFLVILGHHINDSDSGYTVTGLSWFHVCVYLITKKNIGMDEINKNIKNQC